MDDNVQYEDTMTSPVFTITSGPGLIVCTVVAVTSQNEILSSCGLGTVGGRGSGREQICHSMHHILTYQEVIIGGEQICVHFYIIFKSLGDVNFFFKNNI